MPNQREIAAVSVPIETVLPDHEQPRKSFGGPEDRELTANIKVHGLLQPVGVRPDGNGQLVIVAGERRWRACKALRWTEIPVIIHENIKHVQEVQISENLHRKNLTALEEAQAYQKLVDDGLTQKDISKRVNKSQAYISERLALLDLPEKVQELVLNGKLSFSHAKLLSQTPDKDVERIATEAAENKTSVRDLKNKVRRDNDPAATATKHVQKAIKHLQTAQKHVEQPEITQAIETLSAVLKGFRDEGAQ